ncbi:MAG TPA: FtsX-like permease family protein [Candidatus Limnocylindrales bacterium]
MAWIGLALRRLRDDRPATVGLAILLLVTALLASLSPRVLARFADDAVRTEVAAAPSAARSIALVQHLLIGPGPASDPLQYVRAAGLEREQTFPAPVRALIAARSAAVESGRFRIDKATTDPAFARLRIQEGIDAYIHYVQGVPPTAKVTTRDDVGPTAQDGVPVYEVGIPEATAKRFGLALGETVPLIGDPGDPLTGRGSRDARAFATVTGIYEVTRPDADFWLDDPTLIHPVIRALSAEVQLLDAAFLLADGTHDPLARATAASDRFLRYTWRSFLDTGRITDANLDRTITAFRQLQVQYPSANVTAGADTALRTGMLPILERHRARWDAAESIVSVIALGPALVAIGTLALIAVLAARRRRSTMGLARSRGASGAQVVVPVLTEALLVGVPAAVLAAIAAVLLVPAGRIDATVVAAASVVAVGVVVLLATVAGVARGHGPLHAEAGTRIVTDTGSRRLMLEGLIVAGAIGAAILLRQRGVAAVGAANGGAGFDPLVAAVPALVGLAAGIVVVRLYPVPLAAVAWVAARGRGLVPMLAARRAREGGASSAVLLVLLATTTVGAFAMTALDHLDRGADVAAWQEVGASYRLQQPTGALPTGLDQASLPGVEARSGVFQAVIPVSLTGPQALVVMPEANALEAVLAGTPASPSFPAGFATPAPGPIPAIVSRSLSESPRGVALEETFTLSIEGYNLTYRVVEVRDSFPGVPLEGHFVVIAREAFLGQARPARVVPVYELLRAPAGAADGLRAAVEAAAPPVAVTGQSATAAALRAQPVTNAVRALILVAAIVTAAYAALGVAAALALAGQARAQETAHLRTLGLTGRQTLILTVAEHGPTTIAAFLLGAALGIGLFVLLRDALGVAALVGSPVSVPLVLEPLPLLLILLAISVVVGVGLLLGVALQRRVAPIAALRGRFE